VNQMSQSDDYHYYNAVLAGGADKPPVYKLPPGFYSASEKWIIIRECYCCVRNPHNNMSEYPAGNILCHASFVNETDCDQYCCLSNSPNSKKKRFKITSTDQEFRLWFTSADGYTIAPSAYVFDCLLKFR
jgi:hypothetical protein